MPFVPPDPGKVRAILEALREPLAALQQLAEAHGDPLLATEAQVLSESLLRLEPRATVAQ